MRDYGANALKFHFQENNTAFHFITTFNGRLDIKRGTLIHLLELDEKTGSALMTALKYEATVRRMLAYLNAKRASLKKKLHTQLIILVLCHLSHLTLGKNVYIISLKLFF